MTLGWKVRWRLRGGFYILSGFPFVLFNVAILSAALGETDASGSELTWVEAGIMVAIYLLTTVLFLSYYCVRCPRCRKHIDTKAADSEQTLYWPGYVPSPTCPRCLRTRKDVYRFQFWLKPEPWDGICHDEPWLNQKK
ncbi:hypothetical protein [Asticcacaulis endophyticus]|uniref:hypothetical protein n=1 Tax=Asticcacaulis endophyticus TaxID=1395890 RepID=UPI0016769D71|nr:hypothetical protein [Asticcacaulis endophyticus]